MKQISTAKFYPLLDEEVILAKKLVGELGKRRYGHPEFRRTPDEIFMSYDPEDKHILFKMYDNVIVSIGNRGRDIKIHNRITKNSKNVILAPPVAKVITGMSEAIMDLNEVLNGLSRM